MTFNINEPGNPEDFEMKGDSYQIDMEVLVDSTVAIIYKTSAGTFRIELGREALGFHLTALQRLFEVAHGPPTTQDLANWQIELFQAEKTGSDNDGQDPPDRPTLYTP